MTPHTPNKPTGSKSVAGGTQGSEEARSEGAGRAGGPCAGAGGYGVREVAAGMEGADVDGDAEGVVEGLAVGLVVGEVDGEAVGVEVVPGDEEAGDEGVGDVDGDGE